MDLTAGSYWSLVVFLPSSPALEFVLKSCSTKRWSTPRTCLWGSRLHGSWRALSATFQRLNGQVHDSGQWQHRPRGVCSPLRFSEKMSLLDDYLPGDHLLKPTEESLFHNQHFPEITHKPQAMKRNRFWQTSFNAHYCQVCRAEGQPFECFQIWFSKGMFSEATDTWRRW